MSRAIILSFFASFGVLTLFVFDLAGKFSRPKNAIATLVESNGNVRRLANNDLTWDLAEGGTVFESQDTIATGELSSARLSFVEGAQIELAPSTMLILQPSAAELRLTFYSGGAKVRATEEVAKKIVIARILTENQKALPSFIKARSKKTKIEGQAESVASVSKESVELEIVASRAELEAPPPNSTALGTPAASALRAPAEIISTRVTLKKDALGDRSHALSDQLGELRTALQTNKAALESPSLLEPLNHSVLTSKATFRWETSNKTLAKYFEFSIRPVDAIEKASKKTSEKIIRTDKKQLEVPGLAAGRYRWTVRALSESGERSPASPLRLVDIEPQNIAQAAPVIDTIQPVATPRPKAVRRIRKDRFQILPVKVK